VDLLVLALSMGMLLVALRLMWRPDVHEYFQP
jgi:hypothetical protein